MKQSVVLHFGMQLIGHPGGVHFAFCVVTIGRLALHDMEADSAAE
jgi:hypothetical protein